MCPSTWQLQLLQGVVSNYFFRVSLSIHSSIQGYETSFYLTSTASSKDIIITYFCVLFPLVSFNKMIGGRIGCGGGIIGDRLAWEAPAVVPV